MLLSAYRATGKERELSTVISFGARRMSTTGSPIIVRLLKGRIGNLGLGEFSVPSSETSMIHVSPTTTKLMCVPPADNVRACGMLRRPVSQLNVGCRRARTPVVQCSAKPTSIVLLVDYSTMHRLHDTCYGLQIQVQNGLRMGSTAGTKAAAGRRGFSSAAPARTHVQASRSTQRFSRNVHHSLALDRFGCVITNLPKD